MHHCSDGQRDLLKSIEHLRDEASPHALLCCSFRHYGRMTALYGTAIAERLFAAGRQHVEAICPANARFYRPDPATLAVLLPDTVERSGVAQLAHRCTAGWSVQTQGDHPPLLLTLAIGAALSAAESHRGPYGPYGAEPLLSRARLACEEAQRRPGNQVVIADEQLNQQAQLRYEHEAALQLAIERWELTAHLQPIVNLDDGRAVGFECLARWPRSTGELISPAEFLGQAIDSGISAEVDLQVLATCLAAAPRLHDALGCDQPLLLSANISAQLVESPHKIEELLQLLEQHLHTSPVRLQLELLEESLNESSRELDDLLNALAQLGVLLAIDDFGTGYSSLSRLHNLAINTIKVDRSFVERINDPLKPSNNLLKTLIAISHDLQISLTAEGIETPDQQQWLLEQGCTRGQGFLFSEPLCLDDAIGYLRSQRR